MAFPDAVTKIEGGAFWESAVAGISYRPQSKPGTIGKYAFCGCEQLAGDVAIPDAVTKIALRAFYKSLPMGASMTENASSSFGRLKIAASMTENCSFDD